MNESKRIFSTSILLFVSIALFVSNVAAQNGRDDIINAAAEYADLEWTCVEQNTETYVTEYETYGSAVYDEDGNLIAAEHKYCDFDPGTHTGEAYAYGWDDKTETFSSLVGNPWLEWGAGNHKCHYLNYGSETGTYPPDWSTGIDCSGLVCNCWDIARTSTSGLASTGFSISNTDVQKGDILVKAGSHVVIVDYYDDWLGNVYLYEATGDQPYKVWYTSRALVDFNNKGYIARSKFEPGTGIEPSENEIFVYPPTNLTATPGNEQVSLSWIASQGGTCGDVSGYIVYRGINVNGKRCYNFSTDVGNVTNYTDTGLNENTTYYYKVAAYSNDPYYMVSWYSNEASATTPCSSPGTVVGYVKNSSTQGWVQGALVKLYASTGSYTGKSDYTNFGGFFEIGNVELGDYYLWISKTGYTSRRDPSSGSFNITCGETENRGIIYLTPSCAPGKVKGYVKDNSTGGAISNALVKLYTSGGSYTGKYDYTSSSGYFEIDNIDAGDYYLQISKSGYNTKRDPSSGSFNIACGETENRGTIYLTPSSSPPPGCPYVYLWNGEEYLEGSNILAESEDTTRAELDVIDYYKLEQPLVAQNGLYWLQSREFEQEHSWLDQFKLLAVDHPKSFDIGVTREGEVVAYKKRILPVSCVDDEGTDCLGLVNGRDGEFFDGYEGDWLVLQFDRVNASRQIYFEAVTDLKPIEPPPVASIVLQIEGDGNWIDIDVLQPRANWSTDLVDLSPYLEGMVRDLKLRLYWTSHHKLDYAGLARPVPVPIVEQECQLVSAVHSEVGSVTERLLSTDEDYAELIPGEQIELSFAPVEKVPGFKRDFVLVAIGHYVIESPGTPKRLGETQSPSGFWLVQNYPNPFNPETEISYGLSEPSHARVTVFNVLGQEVRTLVDELKEPGYYTVTWDGKDYQGQDVSSGVYFYRLQAGGEYTETKKMVLTR